MPNAKQTRGLGRGFDTLIPKDVDAASLINQGERIQNVLVTDIQPNPDQPRTQFDEAALEELAASIKEYGILQPLVVSPNEQNKYTIVAGERRWRAAQKAGLSRVPVIVKSAKALEQLEMALIENVQRVDLSPIEQAISIERLHQQFSMSYVDIAARLGKAATTINNIVRLLQLPEPARLALQNGGISEGHARAILALKDMPLKQEELLAHIIEKTWSVRQAEQFVLACKQTDSPAGAQKRMAVDTPETKKIARKLDAPVSLRRTAKGGRIEIIFKDDQDLERILGQLG